MDLNAFIGNSEEKSLFKVKFEFDNQKITRYIDAYSEANAKFLAEQSIQKEYPGKKVKFTEIKKVAK
jgi:hypothetical protein